MHSFTFVQCTCMTVFYIDVHRVDIIRQHVLVIFCFRKAT